VLVLCVLACVCLYFIVVCLSVCLLQKYWSEIDITVREVSYDEFYNVDSDLDL